MSKVKVPCKLSCNPTCNPAFQVDCDLTLLEDDATTDLLCAMVERDSARAAAAAKRKAAKAAAAADEGDSGKTPTKTPKAAAPKKTPIKASAKPKGKAKAKPKGRPKKAKGASFSVEWTRSQVLCRAPGESSHQIKFGDGTGKTVDAAVKAARKWVADRAK